MKQNWQNWTEILYLTVGFLTFTSKECGFVSLRIFRHINKLLFAAMKNVDKESIFIFRNLG